MEMSIHQVIPSTALNSNYGTEYTISNRHYPNIFQYEKYGSINGNYTGSLGQSDQSSWYSGSAQVSIIKGKWTYYRYVLSTYKATSTVQHALATGQPNSTGSTSHSNYWLASRCVDYASGDYFFFRMFYAYAGTVWANWLFTSNNSSNDSSYLVRPCVEIDLSRVNIGVTGSGTNTDPYSITAR